MPLLGAGLLGGGLGISGIANLPSNFSDLWAWWDIATLATLYQDSAGTTPVSGDGVPIGYIADRSGNGRYVRQTGATSTRPTYTTGVPGATFDGGDYLDSVATIGNFPMTIIGVARTSTVGIERGLVSARHSTTGGANVLFLTTNVVSATMGAPQVISNSAATFGGNTLVIFGLTSSISTIKNVAQNTVGTDATHSATTTSQIIRVGGRFVNSATSLLTGSLCEICIYSRALTDSEIGLLSTYLNSKWSVY